MARVVVSCGFSETEMDIIDRLVKENKYCSRSDAIRCLTRVGLQKGKLI